ncbi:unnamed protein product [Candidula unifasciata]|uniref:Uncharacterized protein n=1 Tax=Candidula unifasciata TaxID=100452 RepID=A0A8S4A1W6_9EUPU|nr:unnamed protein product [Candidula unifasciata]
MQYRAQSVNGIRLSQSLSKSFRPQDSVPADSVIKTERKLWNVGHIIGQGGFGLIYLGIILPMYVLLKLVELGPCELSFFTGSISIAYIVYSVVFATSHIQVST